MKSSAQTKEGPKLESWALYGNGKPPLLSFARKQNEMRAMTSTVRAIRR
jgi:hypothetical protein